MRRLLASIFAALMLFFPSYAERPFKEAIIDEGEKKIALTFDDGPNPRYTDMILDILSEYNIKATFFVIGKNAELYPEPLSRASQEGHEIGNHTYSHPHMKRLSREETEREILSCQERLYGTFGVMSSLFRPPEGFLGQFCEDITNNIGLKTVLWSIDTRDWEAKPANKIVSGIKESIKSGKVLLFHDYVSGKNTTIPALREILPYLLSSGYEFCTVSELMSLQQK